MEDFADMMDNFNEKILIGETLYIKLYHGTIQHGWLPFEDWVVTVKIWDYTLRTSCYLNADEMLKVCECVCVYIYIFCVSFLTNLFSHLKLIVFYMIFDRKK